MGTMGVLRAWHALQARRAGEGEGPALPARRASEGEGRALLARRASEGKGRFGEDSRGIPSLARRAGIDRPRSRKAVGWISRGFGVSPGSRAPYVPE